MITGINHLCMSVANLDRAIAFYRDLLGMEIVVEGPLAGREYEALMGLEGLSGRGALLALGDSKVRIEIFEFKQPLPKPAEPYRPVCDHGITHFCLTVTDIESHYARLKSAGVRFNCPPLKLPSGSTATYGRDPDGNVFELLEKDEAVR